MKDSTSRRIIYLLVIIVAAVPIIAGITIKPSRMKAAEKVFNKVESLKPEEGKIALLFLDFSPSTKAENVPQSEVLIEHLFRKRIKFGLFSQTALGEGFLRNIPKEVKRKLEKELPGQKWVYGKDWVNFGYRPGRSLFIQGLAKAKNIPEFLEKDARGTSVKQISALNNVKGLKDIILVGEFTGLSGMLDSYIQFMQNKSYIPPIVHGCTSITIPQSYIYLDSNQITGLFEGLSGAAWYSELLSDKYKKREVDSALTTNTSLGFTQLLVLLLILVGNIFAFVKGRKNG